MKSAERILVIAPHADDETLGVGGTMARRIAEGHEVHVAIITGHGMGRDHPIFPRSAWTTVRQEAQQAMEALGVRHLHFGDVPAVLVADEPVWELNKTIEEIVREISPDVLYAPFPFDLHKDHREIFHALSVAWRPSSVHGRKIKSVFSYEVPSETHWNAPYLEAGFLPNTWVDISKQLEVKLRALECYASQMRPFPDTRSVDACRALAMWRGSQQCVAAAEAFVAIRLLS